MMLINKKTLRKNKAMKKVSKLSLKKYGKVKCSVIKTKIGKISSCTGYTEDDCFANTIYQEKNMSKTELLQLLKSSELCGFGAGFSVYEKVMAFINSTAQNKILIVNAVECETGLHNDQWFIENHFDVLLNSISVLKNSLNLEKVILAAKGFPDNAETEICSLCKVPNKYPMGEEHILIKQLFGEQLDKTQIPAEKGYLVLNLQTVYAIYKLFHGEKIDGRYVTLTNLETAESKVAFVKYGEGIKDKLVQTFGKCEDVKYFAGIGNFNADEIDDEVFHPGIAFAAMGETVAEMSNENRCKGCGGCSTKCPAKINVKKIVSLKEKNNDCDISGFGIEKCLHCGTCAYVCHAGKIPFEYFTQER